MSDRAYALFEEQQQARGIQLDQVKSAIKAFVLRRLPGVTAIPAPDLKYFKRKAFHAIHLKNSRMPRKFIALLAFALQ